MSATPRPRKTPTDWAMLPPLRVEPEILAEMEASARALGITLSAWRRMAYRAAVAKPPR